MRKLASIQEITAINPISGADSIEVANVLGWHVVVKKGQFEAGEPVVYVEVDSVLPEKPEFDFLRKCCFVDKNGFKGYIVRTAKLRGQVSQGIVFPLSIIPGGKYDMGQDVTDLMGIVKYDPPIPATIGGLAKGPFPAFIPKTDETRIQAVPGILDRHGGAECYVTEKLDGSSMTAYMRDDEFGICSRNLELKPTDNNALWRTSARYDLKGAIEDMGGDLALQGELIGPGIQGNKYKLADTQFRVFNIYDIGKGRYLDFAESQRRLDGRVWGVPLVEDRLVLDESVDGLVEMAKGKSALADIHREGIVIRPLVETLDPELGRLSFKVINPDFLLKWVE